MPDDAGTERRPRVVIIGAGMAGILAAIRFREAGYEEIAVYEKADRVGGTWRENTYPGIACDVPSHLYSYSFAPNPDWSHVFSPGDEIQAYFERVARDHAVDQLVTFDAEVLRMRWDGGCWHLELAGGRTDRAEIVVAATGVLHHPRYPDIDGLEDFDGAWFHSARWDHDVPIAGRRVGMVGTGSSGVQIVTAIADQVAELHLFQRTAQWVLGVPNPAVEPDEQERLRSRPDAVAERRAYLSQAFEEGFANAVVDADSPALQALEEACGANLEEHVADPDLRERLRPDYRAACKRLVVSPNFYETMSRPNVQLVTEKIQQVESAGVRTVDGELHELDVLVLATGFRVDRFLRPTVVTGVDGADLDATWADHPVAHLSLSVPEFPNLFLLNGPNGPVGNFSLIDVAELQVDYVLQLLEPVRRGAARSVCATREATERFESERIEAAQKTVWVTGCRSWYLDDNGVPAAWPWTFTRFREVMAEPDPDAYVFDSAD